MIITMKTKVIQKKISVKKTMEAAAIIKIKIMKMITRRIQKIFQTMTKN